MNSFAEVAEACNLKTKYHDIATTLDFNNKYIDLDITVAKFMIKNHKHVSETLTNICTSYIELWKNNQSNLKKRRK